MRYMATGKPAHLGCKFLLDVSVVNSPIVVELLVITVLFCVVRPAGSTTQNHESKFTVNIRMGLKQPHASFLNQLLQFHSGNIYENSGSNKYVFKAYMYQSLKLTS